MSEEQLPAKYRRPGFIFSWLILLVVLGLAVPIVRADAPVVVNPTIKTDKSVDTSSIDAILADIVRKDMTDEQKVLACFNWIRRLIYHGDAAADMAYDFHKMINVMGNGSCLRQTSPLAELLKRLGYECEGWTHDGHHMMQVKYGGQWHCLDPHMCFYVYDRSTPPVIASLQQLRADPTLSRDAQKENRACPGFLLCGDSADTFGGDNGKWAREDGFHPLTIKEPFGNITLPRGASYVRTWMPGPYWYLHGSWMKDNGPFHGCGRRDLKDTVNGPLFEPHIAKFDKSIAYRHWGAGRITYTPDLHTDHYLDAMVTQTNIKADAQLGLVAADAALPAEIVLSVSCPYVITAAALHLARPQKGGITATVSIDQGKTWNDAVLAEEKGTLAATVVKEVNGSFDGYQLKLSITGGAAVDGLSLTSHFQLNPYSLPYLVPGENAIDVSATQFGSPLIVEWQYAPGPDWNDVQTVSHTFSEKGRFSINVPGEKYPRNLALTLQVAP